MVNENKLAISIAKGEGKKLSVSIGQIKEVLRLTLKLLSKEKMSDVVALVEKHK